jgi:hypothetical protein
MASEYWLIKRDDGAYWGHYGPTMERLCGTRYLQLSTARSAIRERRRNSANKDFGDRHAWHLIHVRIRPRSERLYLAARLAAWEPVIRAVIKSHNFVGVSMGITTALLAVPPEHLPEDVKP